jgi:hypothetical protein
MTTEPTLDPLASHRAVAINDKSPYAAQPADVTTRFALPAPGMTSVPSTPADPHPVQDAPATHPQVDVTPTGVRH